MRDDDVRELLRMEAERAPRPEGLRGGVPRRARLHRAAFISASTLTVLAVAVSATIAVSRLRTDQRGDRVSQPDVRNTERAPSSNYAWPEPFVPPTTADAGRTILPIVFMDRTTARLSYPANLALAEMGVQTTISYTFDDAEARSGASFDVIAVHGDVPDGLLGAEIDRFDSIPFGVATLHEVLGRGALRGLRGDPPYALVFAAPDWNLVVTLPSRDKAATVAENLHPSVTADGWPSVQVGGALQLSEGFGEARGPHLEFNDEDPRWEVHTRDTYVLMGVVSGCGRAEDGLSGGGADTYAAKCLAFDGGELGIFVSIYGPERFVRDLYDGLLLER